MNKCPVFQAKTRKEEHSTVAALNRAFELLNRNGVLHAADLDAAVLNPALQSEHAAGIAILKAGFIEIRNLNKSGWFLRKTGISQADLSTLERLVSGSASPATEPQRELVRLAEVVSHRAREALNTPKRLFKNDSAQLASVRPEAIKQGLVGNCYFLAAVASVAMTSPKTLINSITRLSPDTFQVVFAGAPQERYIVQPPTVMELSLYAQITQYGFWPSILEQAYGKYLIAHGFQPTIIPTDATSLAEKVHETFDLITGQMGRWQSVGLATDQELDRLMTAACREQRALAATSNPSPRGDKDRTIDGIPAQHAYSILDWNSFTKRLTVRNPWGVAEHGNFKRAAPIVEFNKKRGKGFPKSVTNNGTPKNRLCDDEGVFIINMSQLRRNFQTIYFEDWLPDGRF